MKDEVDEALQILENSVVEVIPNFPKHVEITLRAITSLAKQKKERILTGDVYKKYVEICSDFSCKPHSSRSMRTYLMTLESLGFIEVVHHNGGRFGNTREIELALNLEALDKALKEI